jgi:hypothetical protein
MPFNPFYHLLSGILVNFSRQKVSTHHHNAAWLCILCQLNRESFRTPKQSLERFCVWRYVGSRQNNRDEGIEIESLTKKAGDEILDKKLEEKLDNGG